MPSIVTGFEHDRFRNFRHESLVTEKNLSALRIEEKKVEEAVAIKKNELKVLEDSIRDLVESKNRIVNERHKEYIKKLNDTMGSLSANIGEKRDALKSMGNTCYQLGKDIASQKKSTDNLSRLVSKLEAEKRNVRDALTQMNNSLKLKRDELGRINKKIVEKNELLENILRDKTNEIGSLNSKLEKLHADIADAELQIPHLEERERQYHKQRNLVLKEAAKLGIIDKLP